MATDTRNLPAYLAAGDADFRTWGVGVAAALVACGLVKVTAETGQIDWATVAKPGVTHTAAGYEMYRFNDSLQATKPVYIKVEYGTASSVNAPSLWVTVGSSTNGSGTITGVAITSRRQCGFSAPAAGSVWTAYTSGGDGRIAFYFGTGSGSSFLGFMVERGKTEQGVLDGNLVYFLQLNGQSSWGASILQLGVAVINASSGTAMAIAGILGWSNVGSNVCFSPHMMAFGKWLYTFILTYVTSDLTSLATFQTDYLGATRTFLPLSVNASYSNQGATSNHSLAMLWE